MEIADELEDVLRSATHEHGVPGAAAGVLVDGEMHTAAVGITSVEHPIDVDATTLFQVGSVSKTFTSAAAMVLVEEGHLDIADPVARHLPELGPATGLDTEAITIEHLLSHQSGFDGDHLFITRHADDLTELANARRFFEPGTGVSYNNAGFSIAGAVIEAVTGEPYEDVMRRRILEPLGMRTAGFRADAVITNRVAMPHLTLADETFVLRAGGWQRGWELGPLDRAAGGLIASVDHLLRWGRFQLDGRADDGSELLSAESLQRLHAPVVEMTGTTEVGLDWFVEEIGGATVVGHGGETPGYVTDLAFIPDQEIGIACTANAVNADPVIRTVRRWMLERVAGLSETDPDPDPTVDVDVDRLVGRYLHAFGWIDVTRADEPGQLRVDMTPRDDVAWQPPAESPCTIAAYGQTDFRSVDLGDNVRTYRFDHPADDAPAAWIQPGYRRAPRVD